MYQEELIHLLNKNLKLHINFLSFLEVVYDVRWLLTVSEEKIKVLHYCEKEGRKCMHGLIIFWR